MPTTTRTTPTTKSPAPASKTPARKPQDHLDKKPGTPGRQTVEYAGQCWSVDEGAFDDYELLELIARCDNGESQLMPLVFRQLLGDEQHAKAKESMRPAGGGRITLERAGEWLRGFMVAASPNS